MVLTFDKLDTLSSIGIVTKDSTSFGDAPGKTVETITIGILICGFKTRGKLEKLNTPIKETKRMTSKTSRVFCRYFAKNPCFSCGSNFKFLRYVVSSGIILFVIASD